LKEKPEPENQNKGPPTPGGVIDRVESGIDPPLDSPNLLLPVGGPRDVRAAPHFF
jgi:hypothetical protein